MDYDETVRPYLNTNMKLDGLVDKLWNHWTTAGDINIDSAKATLKKATAMSPNIIRPETYIAHCLQVSRRCVEAAVSISENYPIIRESDLLNPTRLAFMGLIEDSFYLIGGNGQNNPNGEDSNPLHEILTYIQLNHLGCEELAESIALHFVAFEILAAEHERGRFTGVAVPENQNLRRDIVTAVDALCTSEYLPETKGSVDAALQYRIEDIRSKRGLEHPLAKALENGGEERLRQVVQRLERLMNNWFPEPELTDFYKLQ